MTFFVYLGIGVAGLCVGVAVWAAWLSRLERWRGAETVALTALGAAGYQAIEALCIDPSLHGGGLLLLRLQATFAGCFVGGFLARRAIRDRRPLLRDEALSLALAGVITALYWVPGVSASGVTTRDIPWMGVSVLTMDATVFARVQSITLIVLLARGFYQVGQDQRSGRESLRGIQLAGYGLVVAAVVDQLSVMGVWSLPELVGLSLVFFVLGAVHDVVQRIERSDAEVQRLQDAMRELAQQRGSELMAAREELEDQTRFTVLGELAAGIAHEINNPASTVVNNLTFLLEVEALQGDARAAAEDACQEAGRISRLVKRLVRSTQVGDSGRAELYALPLRKHVLNAVVAVEEQRPGVLIATDVDESILVHGHPEALELILISVLRNVVQTVPPDHPSPLVEVFAENRGAKGVLVLISDNGVGMGGETLGEGFDPFFTNSEDRRSGLGLSVSYGLLRSMGGELELHSVAGQGTMASIRLQTGMRHQEASGRATILLVDDEAPVRNALRRSLSRRHRVLTASSVAEAIDVLEKSGAPDLILCDMMMPVANGDVFYRELEKRWPELVPRLVFMTGSVTGESRAFIATWKGTLLHKPFGVTEVQDVLEARGVAGTTLAPGP